jgi:hypothetical protein
MKRVLDLKKTDNPYFHFRSHRGILCKIFSIFESGESVLVLGLREFVKSFDVGIVGSVEFSSSSSWLFKAIVKDLMETLSVRNWRQKGYFSLIYSISWQMSVCSKSRTILIQLCFQKFQSSVFIGRPSQTSGQAGKNIKTMDPERASDRIKWIPKFAEAPDLTNFQLPSLSEEEFDAMSPEDIDLVVFKK